MSLQLSTDQYHSVVTDGEWDQGVDPIGPDEARLFNKVVTLLSTIYLLPGEGIFLQCYVPIENMKVPGTISDKPQDGINMSAERKAKLVYEVARLYRPGRFLATYMSQPGPAFMCSAGYDSTAHERMEAASNLLAMVDELPCSENDIRKAIKTLKQPDDVAA